MKPNLSVFCNKNEEEISQNNSDFTLRRTRKKEPIYDPRHSEETASNSNSRAKKMEFEDLKKACIFEPEQITINIKKVERKTSEPRYPQLPLSKNKSTKKNL